MLPLVFLFIFLSASSNILCQKPSPCPEIFVYEPKNATDDKWYGILTLQVNDDLTGVWLHIALDTSAELLGNWFGEATSTDNKEFTITNKNYHLEAGPPVTVRFFVKFSLSQIVPSLESIRLNGKTICPVQKKNREQVYISQPKGRIPTTERSSQREKLKPTTNTDDNEDSEELGFFSGDFTTKRTTVNNTHVPLRNVQCGTVVSRPLGLIAYGQATFPGQWPWHAALYYSQNLGINYICGATLITIKHVITAAHCVTVPKTNRKVRPEKLLVYLGKYNIDTLERGFQDRQVADIIVHPEYNHSSYFNDISILELSTPVEYTNNVRPSCLWEEDDGMNSIVGKEGIVVGWGYDQYKRLSKTLMQVHMPIKSAEECLFSNREFFSQFLYYKNFCAGFRNGTAVCNGDSGGGMVFPRNTSRGILWQLRGIVSIGVALQTESTCDTSQYSVFTDVAKYVKWIKLVTEL